MVPPVESLKREPEVEIKEKTRKDLYLLKNQEAARSERIEGQWYNEAQGNESIC